MCDNPVVAGASKDVEDLDVFSKWVYGDEPVPYPSCLKEPPVSKRNSANMNPPGGGGSQRSRMFVNSNREHGGKPKGTDKRESTPAHTSISLISWDTPILPESVPKVCLTDNEFAAVVRAKRDPTPDDPAPESSNDNCPHFIIHSQCYCDSSCTVGVCTNCFLVFCNPNCLKGALRRGGKIADVSKLKLDQQPFGFSRQNFTKPFVSEVEPGDTESTTKAEDARPQEKSEAEVPSGSTSKKGVPSSPKDLSEEKLLGEARKRSGRGRGRGALPFGSETTIVPQPLAANPPQKSSSSFRGGGGGKRNTTNNRHSTSAPPINNRPSGIFSHSHGFREAYGEIDRVERNPYAASRLGDGGYELGGKGHFDRSSGGPAKVLQDFPSTSSFMVGRSVGRGRGRLLETQALGFPLHYKPIEPLLHTDKVLRDPVGAFFGNRTDASAVPVFRGHSNIPPASSTSTSKPKNPFLISKPENGNLKKPKQKRIPKGDEECHTVRLHGNVEVKLTTPMTRGAYDSYDDSNRKPFTETDAYHQDEDECVPLRPRQEPEGGTTSSEESGGLPKDKGKKVLYRRQTDLSESDDGALQDRELLRLEPKTGVLDSAEDSECDVKSQCTRNDGSKNESSLTDDVVNVVSSLWEEIERIHTAEVDDAVVTATEDHELNGLLKEVESLSSKKRECRRPIDEEMQVPLGVFVIVRPTCILDANRMYLRWEDEKLIPRDAEMSSLQKIRLEIKESMMVGDYCVVLFDGDILNNSGRQRAQILRLANSSQPTVRVRLIDIGCEEEILPQEIFVLPQSFFVQRRLCFRFGLLRYLQLRLEPAVAGMQEYLQKAFALHTTGIRIDAFLSVAVDRTRHWGEMFCFAGALKVRQDLIENGCVTACTAKDRLRKFKNHFVMTSVRCEAHGRNNFEVEDAESVRTIPKLPVYLCSGATSFNNFFVIRKTELDVKVDVEDRLNRYASVNLLEPYSPWDAEVGDLCLAIVSEETSEIFRAQVAYIDECEAVVRLLDTGRLLKTPLNSLRQMPQALRDIPSLALACSLPVVPIPGKSTFNAEVLRKLDRLNVVLAENVQVIAHVLRPIAPSKFEVELVITPKNSSSVGGISFSESLVGDGGAVWAREDFRKEVLYPLILEKELPESSSSDSSTDNEAEEG